MEEQGEVPMQTVNGHIKLKSAAENVRHHLREVMKQHKLPSLPVVVTKVINTLKDPDFSVRELSRIISDDTALASRTLMVARSGHYAQRQQPKTVHEAILVLGFQTLRSVVMATAAQSFLTRKSRMAERLWSHSLAAALAARVLARRCRFRDPELAFLGGLLHDVGEMVLLHGDPRGFEIMIEELGESQASLTLREKQMYGFDHCAIGMALLDHWNIDESISEAVFSHHERLNRVEPGSLAQILAMADYVSFRANFGFYSELPLPNATVRGAFGCEEIAALDAMVQEVRQAYEKESVLFKA
jgi:putative nucleotidyltransferase with HDIG domain